MSIAFLVLLFALGACFGSFLCCQARRLYIKSTKKGTKKLGLRSVCLRCHYQLKWYDNIPIVSWLILRGKCRKCGKKIGFAEIISELGTALTFLALGTTINFASASVLTWISFIILLVLTLCLIFLAIYDGLYGELPTKFLIISIVLSVIFLSLQHIATLITSGFTPEFIYKPVTSVLILGGLYLLLHLISKGKWVGDGDWLLATAIGIALGDPWLALVTLFFANFFACLYALPHRQKHPKIHLGPFLVIAFIITFTFSYVIMKLW